MKSSIAAISLITAFAVAPVLGAEPTTGPVKDAWLLGKVETVFALNPHLNGFAINTDVAGGAVRLTGKVESEIDRDLAGELAEGVAGVTSVDNDLVVETQTRRIEQNEGQRPFSVWVDDVTTTAAVKTKLVANANMQGLEIDVDTRGDVVTLSGEVSSAEVKQLAEQIARNTVDVKDVHNQLVVHAAQ